MQLQDLAVFLERQLLRGVRLLELHLLRLEAPVCPLPLRPRPGELLPDLNLQSCRLSGRDQCQTAAARRCFGSNVPPPGRTVSAVLLAFGWLLVRRRFAVLLGLFSIWGWVLPPSSLLKSSSAMASSFGDKHGQVRL